VTDQSAEAVLVTGVYGSGKTTAIEEMAAMLETARLPYAAIDLDWLAWANLDDHGPESHRLLLANLGAVVGNARAAGMTRFLLAGTVADSAQVADLAAAAEMPVRTVRLVAPIEVIADRLSGNPTSGRQNDLAEARRAAAAGRGASIGDLAVASDRPVAEVADEILAWLGWLPPE
jgi:hypothetical protein